MAVQNIEQERISRAGNWFGRKYDPYYTLIVAIIFWWVTIFTAIIALYFK